MSKKRAERLYKKVYDEITKEHGTKETTNIQLEPIGKKLFGNKFVGVFPSDQIPILKKGQYAIVNLDIASDPGSHWVSLVKTDHDKIYMYDSFGRKTFKILPSLVQSGNGVILETELDPEQEEWMEDCGQRSLAAIAVYDQMGVKGLKWV